MTWRGIGPEPPQGRLALGATATPFDRPHRRHAEQTRLDHHRLAWPQLAHRPILLHLDDGWAGARLPVTAESMSYCGKGRSGVHARSSRNGLRLLRFAAWATTSSLRPCPGNGPPQGLFPYYLLSGRTLPEEARSAMARSPSDTARDAEPCAVPLTQQLPSSTCCPALALCGHRLRRSGARSGAASNPW